MSNWRTLGGLVKLYLSVQYARLLAALDKLADVVGRAIDKLGDAIDKIGPDLNNSDIAAGEAGFHLPESEDKS